jgi:hypothetical protein
MTCGGSVSRGGNDRCAARPACAKWVEKVPKVHQMPLHFHAFNTVLLHLGSDMAKFP